MSEVKPEAPVQLSPDEVAALTPAQRIERVQDLIVYSNALVDWVVKDEQRKSWRRSAAAAGTDLRTVVAKAVLFSGGNDSTTLVHMFRDVITHAIHANTTIGIEATRQYVRDVCRDWDIPLLEKVAPVTYRELVLDQGFPGPAHHWKMYQRLKERPLRLARKELIGNPRRERVIFLAGRRRTESERRSNIPEIEYQGSVVWVSPLAYWTKLDLGTYRAMFPDVPRNEVSDLLHMSGECLCGAFAHPGELEEIEMWFPEVAREIRDLEDEVLATGKHKEDRCKWGSRKGKPTNKVGALCSDCKFEEEGN